MSYKKSRKTSNTDVVEAELGFKEQLAVLMPTPEQIVLSEDIDDILNGFGHELAIADAAQALLDQGREFKAMAKKQQEEKVSVTLGLLKEARTQLEAVRYILSTNQKIIRDQIFGDTRVNEAVALLRDHAAWDRLTSQLEARVPVILEKRFGKEIAEAQGLTEVIAMLETNYMTELEVANEFGAAGNRCFEERAALLRENGFNVKEAHPAKK